jgi:DMSO reductase family type II enzyme chaperone
MSPHVAPAGARPDADAATALCRSALYEALALGFRPPAPETAARLATPAGAAGLVAAAGVLDAHALGPLVRRLAATDTRPAALDAAYRRVAGHTTRGEAPLYETEYGSADLFQQPQELADLAGFYGAFGLVAAPGGHERPDHVACEAEFLMFLARKEAHALEQGDGAMLEVTRRAARLFLRDHFGRFVPALAARLERADPDGFYGALGALAAAFVAAECARADVPAGAVTLRLREPVEDRVPMACGSCPVAAPGAAPDGEGDGD